MTVKITWQLIVYNDDYILEQVLKTALRFGEVVAVEGPVEYFAKQGTSTDHTNEILHAYLPESNIKHGVWNEKDEMVNAAIPMIPKDTTHVWEIDADELYPDKDIERILELLQSEQYDAIAFHMKSFYGGLQRIMEGFESKFDVHRIQRFYEGCRWQTHRPPTILAPDGKPWREHRYLSADETEQMDIWLFHYSYLWASQMKRKASYYHNMSPTGTIENYFERVYLPWVSGDDAKKQEVENLYDGVHDWVPSRRGSCRTVPFTGKHPEEIERSLPELQARFERELDEYEVQMVN